MTTLDSAALSLEVSRRFAVPPERVFDAWLSEVWCEWLPPKGATCTLASMEAKVGGSYVLHMTMPDGRTVQISGNYREIVRPHKLVLTWMGSYNNQETIITVDFRPEESGTLMTLRQYGFAEAMLRDGYIAGWTGAGGSFDKLAELLSKKTL